MVSAERRESVIVSLTCTSDQTNSQLIVNRPNLLVVI